jgi:hypothetical protein
MDRGIYARMAPVAHPAFGSDVGHKRTDKSGTTAAPSNDGWC